MVRGSGTWHSGVLHCLSVIITVWQASSKRDAVAVALSRTSRPLIMIKGSPLMGRCILQAKYAF